MLPNVCFRTSSIINQFESETPAWATGALLVAVATLALEPGLLELEAVELGAAACEAARVERKRWAAFMKASAMACLSPKGSIRTKLNYNKQIHDTFPKLFRVTQVNFKSRYAKNCELMLDLWRLYVY